MQSRKKATIIKAKKVEVTELLFYTGILLNGKRNRERYRYPKTFWLVLTAALLLGLATGLPVGRAEAVILAGAAVTSALVVGNLHFYHKGIRMNHGGN